MLVLQLIPVDRSVPQTDPQADFLTYANTPFNLSEPIKAACYDCHSNQTKYPWYAKVAPVSFWIQHHVDEGREHLNFSEWTTYDPGKQLHKMEEIVEEIKEGHMPFPVYLRMHDEAEWDAEKEAMILEYLTSWVEILQ